MLISENGKCRRHNAARYCIGDYALAWICHNVANSFSSAKWGIIPVLYPWSTALYGISGFWGPSINRSLSGATVYGCVPDKDCYWLHNPPASPFGIAATPLMTGIGKNLDIFWNTARNEWWESNASYNDESTISLKNPVDEIYSVGGWY